MPKVRELGHRALKNIYQQYLKKDFPLGELRPLSAMDRAMDRGIYKVYGYDQGRKLTAYAAFYFCKSAPFALLDYFAVIPGLRGQGIGSAFLKALLPVVPVEKGIFIETESTASAKSEKERDIREKRISFYKKNGALTTGVNCRLFGVDYNILYCPKDGTAAPEDDFLPQVRALYRDIYGPLAKPMYRLYRPE